MDGDVRDAIEREGGIGLTELRGQVAAVGGGMEQPLADPTGGVESHQDDPEETPNAGGVPLADPYGESLQDHPEETPIAEGVPYLADPTSGVESVEEIPNAEGVPVNSLGMPLLLPDRQPEYEEGTTTPTFIDSPCMDAEIPDPSPVSCLRYNFIFV